MLVCARVATGYHVPVLVERSRRLRSDYGYATRSRGSRRLSSDSGHGTRSWMTFSSRVTLQLSEIGHKIVDEPTVTRLEDLGLCGLSIANQAQPIIEG